MIAGGAAEASDLSLRHVRRLLVAYTERRALKHWHMAIGGKSLR